MTREEAIDLLDNLIGFVEDNHGSDYDKALKIAIKALEQEPKTGHWVMDGSVDCYLEKVRCHCSECGKKKNFPADYDHIKKELSISYRHPEFIDNYCPDCGARMKEGE